MTGVLGAATMLAVAVPAVEAVLAALVATQLRATEPEVPAVKVTPVPVLADERVPLVMVQARVMPAWAGVEAV